MKVFAIFITVLVLLTGFDLCKDEVGSEGKKKTELKAGNSSNEQDSACTPFCNCARCPFSVMIPTVITDLLIDNTLIRKFCSILPATPIEVSASVWQPPKFA
jgi:hypothetical protein